MEGFAAMVLVVLKVTWDFLKERREKQHAVKVINGGNRGNPEKRNPNNRGLGRGGTSTDLVLHLLEEHGEKLTKLEENMMDVRVDLAKIETRLNMKEENS